MVLDFLLEGVEGAARAEGAKLQDFGSGLIQKLSCSEAERREIVTRDGKESREDLLYAAVGDSDEIQPILARSGNSCMAKGH